jgi:outer membrane protein assembly factor BamB
VRAPGPGRLPLSPNALRRSAVALLALAVALSPSFAGAQVAPPSWSQFQGSAGHAGALADGPAPPYRLRWTRPAPEGRALSGAVLFGGQALTVGQTAVYALDLSTGDVVWQVPRDGGPLSVPAVVAGTGRAPDMLLYLEGPAEGDGSGASPSPTGSPSASSPSATTSPSASPSAGATAAGSDLVAIDLSDRSELWRASLGAESRTGVAVEGDAAFVADNDGTVYAIALADGTVRWSRDLGADGQCEAYDGARIDSPVAVADGRVVTLARNNDARNVAVSAYDQATGSCVWRVVSALGSSAASAPAAGDGSVVVGFGDRFVRSLNGGSGGERWAAIALSLFLPVSSPALADGAAYAVDLGGGVYRLDAASGDRRWSYQLNDTVVRNSPVVSGSSVLVGTNEGRLVAIDAASGHLVWESPATPGLIGAIALSPDVVVAVKGGRDAGLVAYEPDPSGTLVDVPSPTELDLGTTLARFGLAAVISFVVVLVPGVLARRRFGDAFVGDDLADDVEDA